jgi:hypothetical protein
MPNSTFYSQLPILSSSEINNITQQAQANKLNVTQINNLTFSIQSQFQGQINNYTYAGAIFYSEPTAQIVQLECHFINDNVCSNYNITADNTLNVSEFTDYLNNIQSQSPYNASIIFQNSNPSLGLQVVSGIESGINYMSNACSSGKGIAGILCNIPTFGIPYLSYNLLSLVSGGSIIIPQIPIPEYAETQLPNSQAISFVSNLYPPSQPISVEFNYENNFYNSSNMAQNIYSFNNGINGNEIQQEQAQFFGNSVITIFIISIICYIVLKFNGAD